MSTREPDQVLRMALAAMAADPTSSLTVAQRQWIIALASRTDRLTPHERTRLKAPLLAWIKDKMPRCEAIVLRQFNLGGEEEDSKTTGQVRPAIHYGLVVDKS